MNARVNASMVVPDADRPDRDVFHIQHVAGWCVVGAAAWAGLLAAGHYLVNVIVQML